MADNRVVIKINYDKDRRRKELIDPKMVTVWHKERILGAIVIIVLLIGVVFYWNSTEQTSQHMQAALENDTQSKPIDTVAKHEAIPAPIISGMSPESVEPVNQIKSAERPPAIIYDKRVIRASLNKEPRYGEPGEPIATPVKLLTNEAFEAFYFSEIKNMKKQVLFHHWFKSGQLVFKKRFDVETDKFKLISSRKLTEKDVGEWQVALIDAKGKHYSEVNFSVNLSN